MKRFAFLLPLLFFFSTLSLNAVTCTATGFFRDGINMTAAIINPSDTVTGRIDATGCNIGIYINTGDATIDTAEIFGSNYFGVVVNGDSSRPAAIIGNSNIHDIGESPLNGTQHGIGIYFRSYSSTGSAVGVVSNNSLSNYQKGGVVAVGQGVNVVITDNIVSGQGRVDYIAQNGIEVGYGARASVRRNTVTGNAYTGTNNASSAGILVVGGPGYGTCPDGVSCRYTVNARIMKNTLQDNDVGVWLSNLDGDADAPSSATNIKVLKNEISNSQFSNVSGNGYPNGYQAGVSDVGNNDKIIANSISGAGYAPPGLAIDTTGAKRAKVHNNVITN
jgi:hypothetical protein